jgi:hypothetical protein
MNTGVSPSSSSQQCPHDFHVHHAGQLRHLDAPGIGQFRVAVEDAVQLQQLQYLAERIGAWRQLRVGARRYQLRVSHEFQLFLDDWLIILDIL